MNEFERMTLIMKALRDPVFFNRHPYFCGYDLYPKLNEIMRQFYETDSNGQPKYNELIMICGMRSGKTTLAGRIALYELFKLLIQPDPAAAYGLEPGDEIFIIGVAKSEDQAHDTIFTKIKTPLLRSPFFREYNPKIYNLEVRFPEKNVTVLCGCASAGSMVGRNVKAVVFDELSKFDDTQSQRGAWQIYTQLSKSTQTFGLEGKRIVTTSPLHVNDIGMQLLERSEKHPHMLGIQAATWELNPRPNFQFDSPTMRAERDRDLLTFWRDYGAQPFASVEAYFRDPDLISFELPRNALEMYFKGEAVPYETTGITVLSGDPAKKHDAFGLCLARLDLSGPFKPDEPQGTIFAEGLYRLKPTAKRELDPIYVKDKICDIIRKFHVRYAVFDTWNYPEAQETIRRMGVPVFNHIVKKDDYDRLKRRMYYRSVKLCPYDVLRKELLNLQLINAKRIDHVRGGSKDVADALANAIWLLDEALPKKHMPVNVIETFV